MLPIGKQSCLSKCGNALWAGNPFATLEGKCAFSWDSGAEGNSGKAGAASGWSDREVLPEHSQVCQTLFLPLNSKCQTAILGILFVICWSTCSLCKKDS